MKYELEDILEFIDSPTKIKDIPAKDYKNFVRGIATNARKVPRLKLLKLLVKLVDDPKIYRMLLATPLAPIVFSIKNRKKIVIGIGAIIVLFVIIIGISTYIISAYLLGAPSYVPTINRLQDLEEGGGCEEVNSPAIDSLEVFDRPQGTCFSNLVDSNLRGMYPEEFVD